VLAEPPAVWNGGAGMLDETTAERELATLGAFETGVDVFVCGPAPMMTAVRRVLERRGVPAAKIREEKFSSPGTAAAAGAEPNDATMAAGLSQPQKLDVRVKGRTSTLTVRSGQTLLEAGLAAGLDMPYSCALGGCGACRVKLTAGRTHADDVGCLSPAEKEAGYVLACISKAASPCSVEVE
jgi:ring-1,2-phenylacetyl-CoA epoxidase subunit PaaE